MSPQQNPDDLRAAAMDSRHAHVDQATYRRRRVVAGTGAAVVAVLVVVLLAYVWPGFAKSSDAAPAPVDVTVTAPAPSATSSPAALPSGTTTFLKALPGTVGPWVRTSASAAGSRNDAGSTNAPTESWTVVYQGQGDRFAVTATQYATAAAATGAFTKSTSSEKPSGRGSVLVGGSQAGTYVVVPGSDGKTVVTWHNGTAVLSVTGPDAVVRQFYAAYPM